MRIVYLIGFIALVGIVFFFAWGVQDTHVTSYVISGVSIDDGLVIEGILTIENPSRLPVPVREVTYEVTTDGGVLASGALDGWLLRPGESETVMRITLTSESVLSALYTRSDEITVSGEVHIPLAPPLPFSDTYTIGDAIRGALGTFRDTIRGLL